MKLTPFALMSALMLTSMNSQAIDTNDPYLWLEDVEGEKALEWVETQNARSLSALESLPEFSRLFEKNLAVYDSDERIAAPTIRGDHVYNFWRDAEHERGMWRRTSITSYASDEPDWDVLIDLDDLASNEEENWVWSGVDCLAPDYQRCLVSLSRGGADAVVVREFDLSGKEFVKDGFYLPEAKGGMSFIDLDTVVVSTDFGPGSQTSSGYPRLSKLWKRGTELSEAETLIEGEESYVGVWGGVIHTPERDFLSVTVAPTFFTRELHLKVGEHMKRLDLPEDAEPNAFFKNQVVVSLKSDWERDEETYPQGALVSIDVDQLLAGEGSVQVILQPDERGAIAEVQRTRDLLLVNRMEDVRSRLDAFTLVDGKWTRRAVDAPKMGTISIASTSTESNTFYFNYTDFLTPTTLYQADGMSKPAPLKQLPDFFDASPYEVTQHFTESADGTGVPYFMVARKDLVRNGENPTLIYAYGGFEVPIVPGYSATIGMDWLDLGGVYVVANIRGGGEYGPRWHQSAQRENRQRSYDDFYAVAEDLIKREVTSTEHLGIRGGSGGGLLVGMLFTQRPDLFKAVVCAVPLLDMWRFNKLLAGASWVEEYGNPDDPDDWAFLQNYSPYHQLKPEADYPRVFFTTSTRDDRVHPGHARKMVARMNEMGHPNFYYENTEGGHGGAANNRQSARVQALTYTYLINELR